MILRALSFATLAAFLFLYVGTCHYFNGRIRNLRPEGTVAAVQRSNDTTNTTSAAAVKGTSAVYIGMVPSMNEVIKNSTLGASQNACV